MGLFPAYIENETITKERKKQITPPKEYEIDFETGQLTGKIVEGKEAIKIWIWFALQIPRYRYYIYTWNYGNEFEDLIGHVHTKEYIEAEAKRMTKECLLINQHIQSITEFHINIEHTTLEISFVANTIYGEIAMEETLNIG